MALRCILLSFITGLLMFSAVIAANLPVEPDATMLAIALTTSLIGALLVNLLLGIWVVRPTRDLVRHALQPDGPGGAFSQRSEAAGDDWDLLRSRLAEADQVHVRLAELEARTSKLRHDLRGLLSPAVLNADRLLLNADPAIRRAADQIVKAIERTNSRISETKF